MPSQRRPIRSEDFRRYFAHQRYFSQGGIVRKENGRQFLHYIFIRETIIFLPDDNIPTDRHFSPLAIKPYNTEG